MASINLGRVVGDPGPKGDRGTVWHLGTGVTGQSTTGTVFSGSGVESAALQDMYLNTNTDDFYTCVLAGNAATAKWAYAGNLKGATGPQGATGPTGKVDSNTPVTFETAATETDINSGESLGTLMGKIKKSISTFRSAIGTLSSLKTSAKTSLVAAINEIFAVNNDLSQAVNGKANASHTHPTIQITDFTEQLNNWGAQANVRSANTAVSANSAGSVPWSGVSGKPSSFTPSSHTHDDRYYTEAEMNNLLNQKITMQKTNYYTLGTKSGITCHVWAIYPTVTVELDGGITQSIAAWNAMTIGTLPSKIRPPMDLIFPIANQAGGMYGLTVFIGTNGQVQIANRSNQNFEISGAEIFTACTYCCAT